MLPVPESYFGRDHWSVFGYLAHCVTERDGYVDIRRMRCDPDRHPGLAHEGSVVCDRKYPTRLRGGLQIDDHDDHDCADDLEAAGLLEHIGTGIHPRFKLTDRGFRVLDDVNRARAEGGTWSRFRPTTGAPC